MVQHNPRAREGEILNLLHQSVGMPLHQAMLDLLDLQRERAKESLVSANPEEFQRLQGRAKGLEDLRKLMTPIPKQ